MHSIGRVGDVPFCFSHVVGACRAAVRITNDVWGGVSAAHVLVRTMCSRTLTKSRVFVGLLLHICCPARELWYWGRRGNPGTRGFGRASCPCAVSGPALPMQPPAALGPAPVRSQAQLFQCSPLRPSPLRLWAPASHPQQHPYRFFLDSNFIGPGVQVPDRVSVDVLSSTGFGTSPAPSV